jgi:uncharacterized protein (DUF1800 family)
VRIACRQPRAATHIARRLYRTLLSNIDDPSPELIAPLAATMRCAGDVDVARGIELVIRSRIFHSEECRTRRVKSPLELAVGVIRGFEMFDNPPDLVDLEIHLTRMGQRLFYPPGVAGWPGGLAWLGGQSVTARANFAAWITDSSTQAGIDRGRLLASRYAFKTPGAWLDAMATLLLGPVLAPESRSLCQRQGPDQQKVARQLLSLEAAQVG